VISPATAATIATLGFAVLGAFQLGLAMGMPWGAAAWGGRNPGRLPQRLRIGSAVSLVVYAISALVVLDRAGIPIIELPDVIGQIGAWVAVAMLTLGALVNAASASPFERLGWAPFAAVMALLCLVVALG
jgi:hypothetical protein